MSCFCYLNGNYKYCSCFFCRKFKLEATCSIHEKLYQKKFRSSIYRKEKCLSNIFWTHLDNSKCCCLQLNHKCSNIENFEKCDCVNCCILLNCNCCFCIKYRKSRKTDCIHINCFR